MKLKEVWKEIEDRRKCSECPLKDKSYPLLFKTEMRVKIMAITEGPNEEAKPEFIASLANHPTFTYLQAFFRGRFQPMLSGSGTYWTHLRKCFLKKGKCNFTSDNRKAIEECSSNYLKSEIEAANPRLIVAVGRKVAGFLLKEDKELGGLSLKGLILGGGIFRVKVCMSPIDVCVVPHPSGRSMFWVNLAKGRNSCDASRILTNISSKIAKSL